VKLRSCKKNALVMRTKREYRTLHELMKCKKGMWKNGSGNTQSVVFGGGYGLCGGGLSDSYALGVGEGDRHTAEV
jgi:hypothetical protein